MPRHRKQASACACVGLLLVCARVDAQSSAEVQGPDGSQAIQAEIASQKRRIDELKRAIAEQEAALAELQRRVARSALEQPGARNRSARKPCRSASSEFGAAG